MNTRILGVGLALVRVVAAAPAHSSPNQECRAALAAIVAAPTSGTQGEGPADPEPESRSAALPLAERQCSLADLTAAGVPAIIEIGDAPAYTVFVCADEEWVQLVDDAQLAVRTVPRGEVEAAYRGRAWVLDAAATGEVPRIHVPRVVHLIEKSFYGQEVIHGFEIRNEGNAPLIVRGAGSTCSCTQAQPGDLVVAAGASAMFEVRLHITSLGLVSQDLWIATNDPLRPRLPLTMTAQASRGIMVFPDAIRLSATKEGSREIGIRVTGPLGFRIQVGYCDPPECEVRIGRITERTESVEYVLVFNALPGPAGPARCSLVLETNHDDFAVVRLPVQLERASELQVRSRVVDGVAILIVTRAGGGGFTLTAESRHADLTVSTPESGPDGAWSVRVQRRNEAAGPGAGNVLLRTDIPGEPPIEVPVHLPGL